MEPNQFQKDSKRQEMFLMLLQNAVESKPFQFEYIIDWHMRTICKLHLKGLKQIVTMFQIARKRAEIALGALIVMGQVDQESIRCCNNIRKALKYYTDEYNTIKDMLKEYRAYVIRGHILNTFVFNKPRTPFECFDYRKIKLF